MRKILLAALAALVPVSAATPQSVFEATLAEHAEKTAEVSTSELRRTMAAGSATLLDTRPRREFAVSHIPGALNVSAKPGLPAHQYVSDVAEIGRLLDGEKARPLILYCNGPFCGKSKRVAAELAGAGYRSVRRYQLGAPGWRALGGAMQTEPEALRYVATDRTAVWIDAREPAAFAAGTVAGARNVPAGGLKPGKDQGVMKEAKDDGRLPMEDHNTRVIVFGADGRDARAVAEAIAGEAFHNVSFVAEPYEQVAAALR